MRLKPIRLIVFCFLLFGNPSIAQDMEYTPQSGGLVHLKEAIDSNYHDAPGVGGFRFRRIILEAARSAHEKDKEVARRKVGLMWQQFLNKPVCPDSLMRLADLLPYSFDIRYQRLMLPAAKEWDLDLNSIDESGRTVLEHLDEAVAAAKDVRTANMLKEYQSIYIEAGARRRADLSFYVKNLMSRFDAVKRFAYGLFPVQKKGKWGWVNEKGTVVIPLQYAAIRYFVRDRFEVSDDGVNFYFIDLGNKRVNSPWQAQAAPWADLAPQKKATDINGDEITIFLSRDTLRASAEIPQEQPAMAHWYRAGADLVGYGYRSRPGEPYGLWKYYKRSGDRWALYCEGYYTTVQPHRLLVDAEIEKRFRLSSATETKEEFIKDLKDRFLFTGEWRFYKEGRLEKILILDDKATIPYIISESPEGTLTLLRSGDQQRMSGRIISECRLSASGHLEKLSTKEWTMEFDSTGKPLIDPLPDLDFPIGN